MRLWPLPARRMQRISWTLRLQLLRGIQRYWNWIWTNASFIPLVPFDHSWTNINPLLCMLLNPRKIFCFFLIMMKHIAGLYSRKTLWKSGAVRCPNSERKFSSRSLLAWALHGFGSDGLSGDRSLLEETSVPVQRSEILLRSWSQWFWIRWRREGYILFFFWLWRRQVKQISLTCA